VAKALFVRISTPLRVVFIAVLTLPNLARGAEPKAVTAQPQNESKTTPRRWDYPATRKPVRQIQLDRVPLPPLPEGVEELKFEEFFRLPVGPRGLDCTERLRALDGKKVRILGFQVREQISTCTDCATDTARPGAKPRPAWINHLVPGRLLLSPSPATINMAHYGLCDDLPPQTVYVTAPDFFGEPVPFTPGLLLLTGTLSVGNKTEADGRISVVRLELETAPEEQKPNISSATPAASATTKNHQPKTQP
jgi:hypothetical protein